MTRHAEQLPWPASTSAWIVTTTTDALAYANRLLRDWADAEDVVQDCYCRLLARAHVYDLPRDGRKLLFESLTNACINQKTRKKWLLSLDGARESDGSLHCSLADAAARPADRLALDRELEEVVAAALERLPSLQRSALERKRAGQSLDGIAEAMNISPTYAGVLVHRARQALARELSGYLQGT